MPLEKPGEMPEPARQEKKTPPPLPPEARRTKKESALSERPAIKKERKAAAPPLPPKARRREPTDEERLREVRLEIGTEEAVEKEKAKFAIGETLKSAPHENNQDAIAVGDNYALVADGMGGEAGGYEASHCITEAIKSIEGDINTAVAGGNQENIEFTLNHAVDTAQRTVATTGATRAGTEKLGSTMTMLVDWKTPEKKGFMGIGKKESDQKISFAHIGDSRIYRVRGESMDQITRDQSFTQLFVDAEIFPDDQSMDTTYTLAELENKIKENFQADMAKALISQVDRKLISKAPAMIKEGQYKEIDGQLVAVFSIKNIREIITSAITVEPSTTIDREVKTMDAEKGDVYIITSDGLHDNLLDSEIQSIALNWQEDPEKMNHMLLMAAKIRMGEKDINSVPELKPLLRDDPSAAKRAKSDDISVVTKYIK